MWIEKEKKISGAALICTKSQKVEKTKLIGIKKDWDDYITKVYFDFWPLRVLKMRIKVWNTS